MKVSSQKVTQTYYLLTLFSTLAASLIWGINTLFLLDAGLSNTAAFLANAFFTVGMVIFEVPTGLVADTRGRRVSYALGASTLVITTLAYFFLWQVHGPLWLWVIVSIFLGLGFTFFSGATEAWLVDALHFTHFKGTLESVFAKGQIIGGTAMLAGSIGGGVLAQITNLGVPYLVRAGILVITLIISLVMMRDLGFVPEKGKGLKNQVKSLLSAAKENGWENPPVRLVMLSAPFTGIGIYVFYAMQPYLLQLYGNSEAYSIAGLAAAIVAGAQIVGGLSVKYAVRFFRTRTAALIAAQGMGVVAIACMGLISNFWVLIVLLTIWGLFFSLAVPIRQAYLNGLIASKHRATVLSFDALLNSSGSAVTQPVLGRAADIYSYPVSFLMSAAIQMGAIPLLAAAHKRKAKSDLFS